MIEDVIEGFFRVMGRFVGQFFIEVVFEIIIKGPGYFIVKLFIKGEPNPDGAAVVITGVLFWLVLGCGAYSLYSNTTAGNA